MHRDPGWPVCQGCGTRLRRYELVWIERADGRRSITALLDLDTRARRDIARVWHEQFSRRPATSRRRSPNFAPALLPRRERRAPAT